MLNIKELSSLKVMNISTLLAENYSMESLEENGKGIIEGFICVLLHHEVLMCYSPGNFYFEEICSPLTTVECQFSMAKVFGLLPMSNSQDIWMQMSISHALLHSETVVTEEMFTNAGPFDLYLWYLTGTTDHMKK